MQMDHLIRLLARLLASSALAALFVGAPLAVDFDPDQGVITVKPNVALAKDGDSDNSGSGSDSSGSGSGDRDRDRDRDNSGSGSDSDNSGPGGGGDDDVNDEDEDRSGRRGGDEGDQAGTKVEVSGDDIEIVFADGTKEEIENGVYERKDAVGNTVEERPATQADRDRLTAAASSGDLGTATRTSTEGVSKVEVEGGNIEVTFADGTKEEIENGVYERKDAVGNTVEERPATQADFDRLAAAAAGGVPSGGTAGAPASAEREFTLADGTKIEVTGDDIEVKYNDGWTEEIEAGRYEMKDPVGNTVIERPATAGDRERLEQQIPG